MKYGLTKNDNSARLIFLFPESQIPSLDKAVQIADLDRSKFIRQAIKEKIARLISRPSEVETA